MEGTFYCLKPVRSLPHSHYPRWWGHPRLLSKACKMTTALAAKANSGAGQVISTLHVMAIPQVHKAKALKELHKDSSEPGLV